MSGWKISKLGDVPAKKETYPKGFHSVGHFFGITGFGINGKSVDKGDMITPLHNELETGQQELFIVLSGKVRFELDGEVVIAEAGELVFCEPSVNRKADAAENGTRTVVIGGPV